MKVLSLFDGISCGKVALDRAGVDVKEYYASEVDKWAILISKDKNKDIIHLGDVNNHKDWDITDIDLIIGGSPCQSISNLGDGSGLNGKSGLFFKYLECLEKYKPKYFILENVVGNKKSIGEITKLLGVEPILINSSLVSGQKRARYYWTNIPVSGLPEDKNIKLKDVLEIGIPEKSELSDSRLKWLKSDKGVATVEKRYAVVDPEQAACLTARSDASWNSNYVTRNGVITKLTPTEYERLQTLPDGYTLVLDEYGKQVVHDSQRYKALGNGWTVDVISFILSHIV